MTSMMRSVGMWSALLSSAAVAAGSSLAPSIPNVDVSRCGTAPPSDALRDMAREMGAKEREQKLQARDAEPIVVSTVVHVVYANETEEGGYIPGSQIDAQFKVLNDAWAPHGVSFEHLDTTYTQNATWTVVNFPEWGDMKKSLRQGGYNTLNLYTVLLTDGFGLLGIGTPPDNYDEGTEDYMLDGVVIQANTLPGGIGPSYVPHPDRYTEGDLANHEVGHWFGLFHTYIERGDKPLSCANGDNDFVDDTPVHMLSLTDEGLDMDCPPGRDTCPEFPGLDPTDNYMSSAWQSCWNKFTPGQGLRARNMWAAFRAGRD
ncbi:hypothetical protein N3K66_003241 [Trichothecium roseum]|uniref:Uncharacterized protein n=1 Tax=Trichothecium roseum TaxID=47278 RepID=A0ACC0V6E5_9HYPO|nr:hypothetical protein N3K66_003241 [Trichothecium roseum]